MRLAMNLTRHSLSSQYYPNCCDVFVTYTDAVESYAALIKKDERNCGLRISPYTLQYLRFLSMFRRLLRLARNWRCRYLR